MPRCVPLPGPACLGHGTPGRSSASAGPTRVDKIILVPNTIRNLQLLRNGTCLWCINNQKITAMTSNIRSTLSAATFFGLVSFVLSSAFFSGLFAIPTVVGFSLLAAYGVVAIAELSYAGPRHIALRSEREDVEVPAAPKAALIAFPVSHRVGYRAAA